MRARGLAPAIGTILIIAVTIIAVVAIAFLIQRYLVISEYLQANAQLLQNKWVGPTGQQRQVAIVTLTVESKAENQLTVTRVDAMITYSDGTIETAVITYDPNTNSWSITSNTGNIDANNFQVTGVPYIDPGGKTQLTFTFPMAQTGTSISSISFQVYLQDPSGDVVSVQSNAVDIS